jgi:nucleoid-associated protein YgaU
MVFGSLGAAAAAAAGAAGAAGAAAAADPAAAAAAVAAAAANPGAALDAAKASATEAAQRMAASLGLKPSGVAPELIDPQTEVLSKHPITESATAVYQPINMSQGWIGYVLVDSAAPAKYQIDSKDTLWKLILAAGFLVITTSGLYQTYSI